MKIENNEKENKIEKKLIYEKKQLNNEEEDIKINNSMDEEEDIKINNSMDEQEDVNINNSMEDEDIKNKINYSIQQENENNNKKARNNK